MENTITEDKENTPICDMRAESSIEMEGEIIKYAIQSSSFHYGRSDLIITISTENHGIKNVKVNKQFMRYLSRKYKVSSLDDINNISINYELIDSNKILIDSEFELRRTNINDSKIIPNYRAIKKYNRKFNKYYIQSIFQGKFKIKEVEADENNIDFKVYSEGESLSINLKIPETYDEENDTIQFVNDVGGGSVLGLENSEINLQPSHKSEESYNGTGPVSIVKNNNDNNNIKDQPDTDLNLYSKTVEIILTCAYLNVTIYAIIYSYLQQNLLYILVFTLLFIFGMYKTITRNI